MSEPVNDVGLRRRRLPSRRTMGRVLILLGVAGVVLSVTSILVGRALVHRVRTSVDQSLDVTTQGLTAVDESITLTGRMVQTVRTGVVSVGTTIATVRASVASTQTAMSDASAFLGGSLPDTLDTVTTVLARVQQVAADVDGALRLLSKVPFGPDYNPAQSFDQSIADLSATVSPLAGQLRSLSTDLSALGGSASDLGRDLDELATTVTSLSDELSGVSDLVEQYRTTAAKATLVAAASRRDLARSARETDLLILVVGVLFALGQVVPIWLGLLLIDQARAAAVEGHNGAIGTSDPA